MAAAAHFSAQIYGQVFGTPPFQNASGAAAFTDTKPYPVAATASFPTSGTVIWPLNNGIIVGGTYVYSVIEVQAVGTNHNSDKYASPTAAATLATNAG